MTFLSMLGQQGGLLLESIRLYRADQVQRERIVHIREVQKQLVEAREEERRSLAAEIHDEPIQMLVGSLVRLNLIRDSLVTRPQLSQQQIDHAITSLTLAEKSMRRIMTGVFPALLQDLGLTAALESLCEDFHKNGLATAPLHISIKVSGIPRGWKLPMGIGLAIYRFVQEGLNNVVGHAGATQAEVTIEYGGELVTLQVVDNGRGVDTQRLLSRRREGHVGLLGLEERLGALGGSITLDSLPAGGGRLWGQFSHECPSPDVGAHWTFEYELTPVSLIKESAKGPAVGPVQTQR
jgi:signal transduction histidine kinase